MRITEAVFEISAAAPRQFPEPDLPEIVFVGRSNVGKSSLLNSLTGKRALAKVSTTPGKTQLINFFRVNGCLRFVDLPGYGYAKVSATQREAWSRLIANYFNADRPIALVLQLLDSRLPLQESDADNIAWFVDAQAPLQIVLTKIDKLGQKDRAHQQRELLGAVQALGSGSTLLPFSALKGTGKEELLKTIFVAAGM
ncbi:MAG: YihA family ribosome biogenesis GTP-binding protein [Ignavibacteria bacterium]|nr:YihA family ribosome biogenesis GTP-binding protein [Ignavibacteria bacterium]